MKTNQNHFLLVSGEIKFVVCFIIVHMIFIQFSYYSFAQVTTAWTAHYRSQLVSHDWGREIKMDTQGNVYVGGQTSFSPIQGNTHVTIIKYDNNGNLLWQYHSPVSNHYINDMEIDAFGNVYYTGYYWTDLTMDMNYLTEKIDSAGNHLWTQQYDGNGIGDDWDMGWALTVDPFQNVYVTGHSEGTTFNGYDWVTMKYNSSGVQQWVARWVNPDNAAQASNYYNEAYEILTDNSGNVYVSGYAFNGTSHELTLLKYNSSGNLLWAQDFNTLAQWQTNVYKNNYMQMDAAGNIYLLGNTMDTATNSNILLLKYDDSGNMIWSRTWNSPTNDSDYVGGYYVDEGLVIDNNANIFVSGTSRDPFIQFTEDIVTLKYDSAGNLQWQNIFNGLGNDEDIAYGIDIDNAGNAYVCGSTYTSFVNEEDYITLKINGTTGATEWTESYNGPVNLLDGAYAIYVDNQQNVYVTGQSFLNTITIDPVVEIITIKYSQVSIGMDDGVSGGNSVIVFPNPASGFICIESGDKIISDIDISNLLGERVISLDRGAYQSRISVAHLSAGIYFLKIYFSNGEVALKKIVLK